MSLINVSSNKSFGGWHKQYTHFSKNLNCDMRFAIYLPPQASEQKKVPIIYWLSGLTCTDENFMQKAGAQRMAAELGIAIVAPDTSPRGEGVADDPDESYDFGLGAGFYLNATEDPWAQHYQMYDYIVSELPGLIEETFPVSDKRAISGHSMGGHGALIIGMKNQNRYTSISAFSPICNPSQTPWGQKALTGYLGNDRARWKNYDACELMKAHKVSLPILVDQGMSDDFLEKELKPELLEKAAAQSHTKIQMRYQDGYDHSYYFIASFIEDHLKFHAQNLV